MARNITANCSLGTQYGGRSLNASMNLTAHGESSTAAVGALVCFGRAGNDSTLADDASGATLWPFGSKATASRSARIQTVLPGTDSQLADNAWRQGGSLGSARTASSSACRDALVEVEEESKVWRALDRFMTLLGWAAIVLTPLWWLIKAF